MENLSDSTLICRFLEAFETVAPRRAHLVMEFLPGGNLCSYVKAKRRISEGELQPLLVQLATALDHMHSLNIVHRDIKLENIIFLDERHKVVRIIDFGFSTRCARTAAAVVLWDAVVHGAGDRRRTGIEASLICGHLVWWLCLLGRSFPCCAITT